MNSYGAQHWAQADMQLLLHFPDSACIACDRICLLAAAAAAAFFSCSLPATAPWLYIAQFSNATSALHSLPRQPDYQIYAYGTCE